MKKIWVVGCVVGLLCMGAATVNAGGIINRQNQSADYIRTLNRNAATDAADIAVFNPAGVMKLENGFYTKADVIYLQKDYSNTVPGYGEFESDEPSIIPGLFAVYKQDRWSTFFSVTIPAGGGEVDYSDGNARTVALGNIFNFNYNQAILGMTGGAIPNFFTGVTNMSMEADSVQIGYTLGGAFKVNEMLSLAAGVRYIDAEQNFKGRASLAPNPALPGPTQAAILQGLAAGGFATDLEVDLERTATGWGYFLGANITPTENLNLGITYFSRTELDFESDVDTDNSPGQSITNSLGWGDGDKQREDLPGLIALGASYRFTPKLRVEVNYTLYLESDANLEEVRFENAGNSYDAGIAFEYTFSPQWKASLGYLYTDIRGMPPENLLVEAPELDANTIAAGVVFSPTERWQISFGGLRVWYDSEETNASSSRSPAGTELEKDVWGVALGVQYRFL